MGRYSVSPAVAHVRAYVRLRSGDPAGDRDRPVAKFLTKTYLAF